MSSSTLERRLGFWDAVSLVVGGVIGTAVFLVPSTLLQPHPQPLAGFLVLIFAGVMSWFGALAYGELAAQFPNTGGEYVFLREAWSPLWGFLLGWTFFVVIQGGGIATVASGFARLLGALVPLGRYGQPAVAAGSILVLTGVNILGVRLGASVNNLLTVMKLSGLAWMIVAVARQPSGRTIDWAWPTHWTWWQFAAALVPALWAYDGWNMSTMVAGEIRQPQRNLPRALAAGLLVVIGVYCLSLWIYLRVLTPAEIVASASPATDAVQRALGQRSALWVTVTMLVAAFGCLNTCIMTIARIYYAQAKDGLFFHLFARTHPRFHTPSTSLALQGLMASALAASGTYETLFSYVTFGGWVFYVMNVLGVMRLRMLHPERHRPFRMPGYPVTPVLFACVGAAFVISMLVTTPGPSFVGLAIGAAGVPLFFHWKRRRTQH